MSNKSPFVPLTSASIGQRTLNQTDKETGDSREVVYDEYVLRFGTNKKTGKDSTAMLIDLLKDLIDANGQLKLTVRIDKHSGEFPRGYVVVNPMGEGRPQFAGNGKKTFVPKSQVANTPAPAKSNFTNKTAKVTAAIEDMGNE